MTVKVAVVAPVAAGVTADPAWMAAFARHLEECGFESIVAVEHTVLMTRYDSVYPHEAWGRVELSANCPVPDPLDLLALLAGQTTTLGLATPKPVANKRIPTHIGGHSRAAARRAGQLGDGLQPLGVAGDGLAALVSVMRAAAEEAGRDPDGLELSRGHLVTKVDAERAGCWPCRRSSISARRPGTCCRPARNGWGWSGEYG